MRLPDEYISGLKIAAWIIGSVVLTFGGCIAITEAYESDAATTRGGLYTVVFMVVYFAPWAVAKSNRHRNASAIGVLNFFLGWTVIGWIAALIWASMKDRKP